jgi:integrase
MASVKIVLRQKENKNGTFPLAIRIIKDRKTSFIHTGHSLKEDDWDAPAQRVKKSHPNHARLNNYLIKKLGEATDISLDLETKKPSVTSHAVRQKIKPTCGSTFFGIAKLYLERLEKSGKYNQYTADKPRIKHFKDFLNDRDIAFSDITVSLLERFKIYLKTTYKTTKKEDEPGKQLSERSIINHLAMIRSVFSLAVKEGIIEKGQSPFGEGKITIKFPPSAKIGLTPEEVTLIENAELPEGSFQNHARNLWLFSFYFAGMRVSDVLRLKWSDIQDNRLHYSMGKNKKGGSLKLPAKAFAIVASYETERQNKADFIFPDLKRLEDINDTFKMQRTIAFTASRLDKYLRIHVAPAAGIEKPLTMHIARHTFGNISGDRIPIQMLQKLYRHSSVTTTIGYQANFIHKDADEALEAVIDFK